MERVDHLLLLLVVVAIVQVLRLVLLVELRACLQSLRWILTAQLRLHVGQVRLLRVRMRLRQRALQVLTHPDHARVITGWAVYLRPLRAPLKFIETTGSSFAGVGATMSIGNVSTLERLLARIDAGQGRGLSVHLLLVDLVGLLVRGVGVAIVHDVLLGGQLVLVCVVVKVVAAIHAIIVPR